MGMPRERQEHPGSACFVSPAAHSEGARGRQSRQQWPRPDEQGSSRGRTAVDTSSGCPTPARLVSWGQRE